MGGDCHVATLLAMTDIIKDVRDFNPRLAAWWSDTGKDEIAKNISVRQPNQF